MIIGLCGCMMQEDHVVAKIRKDFRFVDLIFGTHNVYMLADLLYRVLTERTVTIDIREKAEQIVEDLLIVSEGSFLPKGSPNELKYCEIKGIGDLVLTNDMDNIVWVDNPDDNEYQFYLLEEKTVGVNTLKGKLVKMSDNKRFALMATDTVLTEKMNIMLRHGEKRIYAKVIRKESEGYVICFTSIQQND